ncbi:Small glutamine-rich tetratricopeptide repeat-containing protein 2 [Psilocybe cubensis]|uniref:TPR-like protein n=2 Tax=Psilocybe cubensis TaxID=181762 RepID=A0A8H8CHN8_PSICU|nr:Small glutamine-rich tetratricopeptide repeat-containing protein 2 [Psilocybe cubensis]KAH9474765.1 Small glutamine-rich tetratricopeptide repeat-containing protein 2 [Psilocybe cubensis]
MPPKTSLHCNQHAEHLKTQGNELFQQGQYKPAHRKYTEAIKADPGNAIYYANRAACNLAMKEWATELDPNYAKAWSRLATAAFHMSSYPKSINAWETALKCLPPVEQSSETDKKLRAQFKAGLAQAKKAGEKPFVKEEHTRVYSEDAAKELPWHRAAAMESEIVSQMKISCAIVILQAYREFKTAVEDMKKIKKIGEVNGRPRLYGKSGTLEGICNGIMSDPRVFHLDCTDWMIFEASAFNAWQDGGAKVVKAEAPKRLKREGWSKLRPALSVTVRAWIIAGFVGGSIGKYAAAMEYHSRALEVLEWGERTWQNVPFTERGVMFRKTFIRAVKRMKLSSMHNCIVNNVEGVDFTVEDMADLARDIITDVEANPPLPEYPGEPLDLTFTFGYYIYPKAAALSTLAWHYMQLGHKATTADDAQAAYSQSADYYMQAAQIYPPDEEQMLIYYKVAVEAYWFSPEGKTLEEVLPTLMTIYERLPHVVRIWEHSALASSRDSQVVYALDFMTRCGEALESGKITKKSFVRPKDMVSAV